MWLQIKWTLLYLLLLMHYDMVIIYDSDNITIVTWPIPGPAVPESEHWIQTRIVRQLYLLLDHFLDNRYM